MSDQGRYAVGPCKIYIVDDRDPDREKVIELRAPHVNISMDSGYFDAGIDTLLDSAKIYTNHLSSFVLEQVSLMPFDDGSFVRYNNFYAEPEEMDDEDYEDD
jgi:hypothetical protein